jgi:hypothetical protein
MYLIGSGIRHQVVQVVREHRHERLPAIDGNTVLKDQAKDDTQTRVSGARRLRLHHGRRPVARAHAPPAHHRLP